MRVIYEARICGATKNNLEIMPSEMTDVDSHQRSYDKRLLFVICTFHDVAKLITVLEWFAFYFYTVLLRKCSLVKSHERVIDTQCSTIPYAQSSFRESIPRWNSCSCLYLKFIAKIELRLNLKLLLYRRKWWKTVIRNESVLSCYKTKTSDFPTIPEYWFTRKQLLSTFDSNRSHTRVTSFV